MAVPFSNTKQRLPPGFRNVLEAFAKEVIRRQPENIIEFGALFFEGMLAERDSTGRDIAKIGASLEDRFYNIPFTRAEVEEPEKFEAARRIQTEYRRFHAKKGVDTMREENATGTIEATFRGYKERHVQHEVPAPESPPDTEMETSPDEPEDALRYGVNMDKLNLAATKIQANFKGFLVRKHLQAQEADFTQMQSELFEDELGEEPTQLDGEEQEQVADDQDEETERDSVAADQEQDHVVTQETTADMEQQDAAEAADEQAPEAEVHQSVEEAQPDNENGEEVSAEDAGNTAAEDAPANADVVIDNDAEGVNPDDEAAQNDGEGEPQPENAEAEPQPDDAEAAEAEPQPDDAEAAEAEPQPDDAVAVEQELPQEEGVAPTARDEPAAAEEEAAPEDAAVEDEKPTEDDAGDAPLPENADADDVPEE